MLERAFSRLLYEASPHENSTNIRAGNPMGKANASHTKCTAEDTFAAAVRLTLGHFHGVDVLGVGNSTIRNAAAAALGCDVNAVNESEAESRDLADGIVRLHQRAALPMTAPTKYPTPITTNDDPSTNTALTTINRITILDIAEATRKLAAISGTDSNAAREALISDILQRCKGSSEVRFFVRMLQGSNKLRIGMGESSIIGAAARAVLCPGEPTDRSEQRRAEALGRQMFMARHDPERFGSTLYAIAECRLMKGTEAALRMCKTLTKPVVLTPARAMLASPGSNVSSVIGSFTATNTKKRKEKLESKANLCIADENEVDSLATIQNNVLCQYKYDGERALIHILSSTTNQNDHTVRVFSRVGEDTTPIYKDLAEDVARTLLNREDGTGQLFTSCILDGEIVPTDRSTGELLPFQALRRRRLPVSAPPLPQTPASSLSSLISSPVTAASPPPHSIEMPTATEAESRPHDGYNCNEDGDTATANDNQDASYDPAFIAFDLLELGGEPLVDMPLRERRSLLSGLVSKSSPEIFRICEDVEVRAGNSADVAFVEHTMDTAVRKGCEGLVVKALDGEKSMYRCGARTRSWLKLKKDYIISVQRDEAELDQDAPPQTGTMDTIDLVPLAAYHGRGKRRGVYGSFLMGCSVGESDNGFKTVCKVGTGFSEDMLRVVTHDLEQCIMDMPASSSSSSSAAASSDASDIDDDNDNQLVHPHSVYQNGKIRPVPDVFFEPRFVWEIRAADISLSNVHNAGQDLLGRGLGLRFPRFVRLRGDKLPAQATSEKELIDQYTRQNTRSILS